MPPSIVPRIAIALLGALLAFGARAEPVGFEGMAFDKPEGWAVNPQSRPGIWLAQRSFQGENGRKAGSAIIQLSKPIPASAGSFDEAFARLSASIPELARERPMLKGGGTTVNGHRIAYDHRCCGRRNGVSLGSDTVGISDGRNYYFLMMVSLNLRGDPSRAASRDFDALVRSFRPTATDRAFALVPPAGGGGLDGVYTHLNTGIRPNAFGGTDFYAESEVTVFDRAGLYSTAIPRAGQDVAAFCQEKPTDCGTYRLQGRNRIEMTEVSSRYGILETEVKPLAHEGQDLKIGDQDHRRVPPLPANTRFQGSWRYFFGSAGTGAFSSGSVAVEKVLVMTPDGRFQRSGFSGASSTNSIGGGTTGFTAGRQRPLETGRYEVSGFSLVLVGDDGRRESLSLFQPDRGSDGLLIIDANNYIKREPGK